MPSNFICENRLLYINDHFCYVFKFGIVAGRRTQNEKALHADLILAVTTQLITVVLADRINHHKIPSELKASQIIRLINFIKSEAC